MSDHCCYSSMDLDYILYNMYFLYLHSWFIYIQKSKISPFGHQTGKTRTIRHIAEKLGSLGIIGDKLRVPFKPSDTSHHYYDECFKGAPEKCRDTSLSDSKCKFTHRGLGRIVVIHAYI